MSIKHELNSSNEFIRAIFSADQQALDAALVYLNTQSAIFSPVAIHATEL